MDIVLVVIASFGASILTFFSGFGLGTILLPVFALFFPIESAILMTAIVHLFNNVLKFGLMWGKVNWSVFLRFGLAAMIGAYFGVQALDYLGNTDPVLLFGRAFNPVSTVIGVLILLFAIQELFSLKKSWSVGEKWLLPGGGLSGFFGGLSGHQGALRSIFLLHSGLTKEAYIATGIAIALVVDLTRIPLYLGGGSYELIESNIQILSIALLSAMIGAFLGRRLLQKITLGWIQWTVGILLILIGGMMIWS